MLAASVPYEIADFVDDALRWIGVDRQRVRQFAGAGLIRKHGVSNSTFFKWRSKYGGASVAVSDVKRLHERQAEKAKLKRLCFDLALENAAMKDVLSRRLQGPLQSDRSPRY